MTNQPSHPTPPNPGTPTPDLFTWEVATNPYPTYAWLREHAPVHKTRLPSGVEAWLVTRYADAKQALADPRLSKNPAHHDEPAHAYSKWWMERSPRWYDSGGLLQPGLNLVANGTGRPEPVLTPGQWDAIRESKSGRTSTPNINVVTHTYLDGREVGGIIEQKIEAYDADTGRLISVGRYV